MNDHASSRDAQFLARIFRMTAERHIRWDAVKPMLGDRATFQAYVEGKVLRLRSGDALNALTQPWSGSLSLEILDDTGAFPVHSIKALPGLANLYRSVFAMVTGVDDYMDAIIGKREEADTQRGRK